MAGTTHEDDWTGIGDYPVEVADDGTMRPVPLTLLGATDAETSADHMARVMARYVELKSSEAGDAVLGRAQAI